MRRVLNIVFRLDIDIVDQVVMRRQALCDLSIFYASLLTLLQLALCLNLRIDILDTVDYMVSAPGLKERNPDMLYFIIYDQSVC